MFDELYDACELVILKSEMQPVEDTREDVCKLINKISAAFVNNQITDEENNILVDMLK